MNLNEHFEASHRPPFLEVEVLSIRTGPNRDPLKVRIDRPDTEAMAIEMRALPGDRPAEPEGQRSTADDLAQAAAADDLARRLVAKFTSVQINDGSFVSPAFSFKTPPDPDLLDGHQLEPHELRTLSLAVMCMGSYARGMGGATLESFLGVGRGSAGGD